MAVQAFERMGVVLLEVGWAAAAVTVRVHFVVMTVAASSFVLAVSVKVCTPFSCLQTRLLPRMWCLQKKCAFFNEKCT